MVATPNTPLAPPAHNADPDSHYCPGCAVAGTGDWQMCPGCGAAFPVHAMVDDPDTQAWICFTCHAAQRETAADVFGDDAVLFVTEMNDGCVPGSDEPVPAAHLFVGQWADGDFGVVAQTPDGRQITVTMPRDHAAVLAAALAAALAA